MFNAYFFSGRLNSSSNIILVIAGVHGSELSGIEVANWMRVKLLHSQVPPVFPTIIIPEVFPEQAKIAREYRLSKPLADASDDNKGRLVERGKEEIEPNRNFPVPGQPLSSLRDNKSPGGQTLLSETMELVMLIQAIKPLRIVSIHAHSVKKPFTKGHDAPGIFVDPRYTFGKSCLRSWYNNNKEWLYNVNLCKFDLDKDPAFPSSHKKEYHSARDPGTDIDDALALLAAEGIASKNPNLVPGNHLFDPPAVVHYSGSEPPKFKGFSLGDWAPVTVGRPDTPEYRPGAPVFTVEVFHYFESWAFINGEQFFDEKTGQLLPGKTPPLMPSTKKPFQCKQQRSKELQIYADALITTFLNDSGPGEPKDLTALLTDSIRSVIGR
jgi:hypothetical protein